MKLGISIKRKEKQVRGARSSIPRIKMHLLGTKITAIYSLFLSVISCSMKNTKLNRYYVSEGKLNVLWIKYKAQCVRQAARI